MKSQFVALAIVLGALPALAWGQGSCGCTSRVPMRSVPASYGAWADYQPAGHHDGCGCNSCTSCAPSCCSPCCGRQLLCIIPNTVKKIGCALDCLVPRGPICCTTGCRVGCTTPSCTGGCPSCSSAADPFVDDLPMPPMPKPTHETRRQPTRAPRDYATAPTAHSKVAASRPATKSVLTRNVPAPVVVDEISRTNHTDSAMRKLSPVIKRTSATAAISDDSDLQPVRRSAAAIPHNPLR
jgi:hypothetical protein